MNSLKEKCEFMEFSLHDKDQQFEKLMNEKEELLKGRKFVDVTIQTQETMVNFQIHLLM